MKRARWIALLSTMAVVASLTATTMVAGAQGSGSGDALKASDVGITAKEIRIAVIADVDNQFQPGLFAGAKNSVQAFAKYINQSCKPKNTCVAGRKLVVDFYDSHLNANESRNAMIQACENDFATVGTTALFLNNVDDMVGCVDKNGDPTGLPDMPGVATEFVHQCSPVTFPINPPQLDCSTQNDHPQTYRVNVGSAKYYRRTVDKKLHGLFAWSNDVKSAEVGGRTVIEGQKAGGVKADNEQGVSSLAPQAAYTPLVQQMKQDGSNYALNMGAYSGTVAMRKEAKLQGINPDEVVWDCFSQCYDQHMIEQGGDDVEGEYVTLVAIPFEEAKYNQQVANYIEFTGRDKIDGFGEYAWIDSLLFRDSVDAIVKAGGDNALTRKAMLQQLADTHSFDADGMWGKVDIGARKGTPCFLMLQVQHGKFKRVYPKKPGTRDCKATNAKTVKVDLIQ